MSPVMATLVTIILCLHVASIALSYGLIYARLQRGKIERARANVLEHMWRAALYSMGGVFTIPFLLAIVRFPNYGIKFFPYETSIGGSYWLEKEAESIEISEYSMKQLRMRGNRTGGRCKSIW
jgi:hypothetical protein